MKAIFLPILFRSLKSLDFLVCPFQKNTAVLVQAVTALVAVLGFAVGAAFALGARPIEGHILAGHYLRQSLPPRSVVEVDGRRGRVERVGPVDTLFRDEAERAWSVPNARLLEATIGR